VESIFMAKLRRYAIAGSIIPLFNGAGAALADTSSFSIEQYPGITKWNALALAVDPNNGNVFVMSISLGGEDNVYKFSPDGSLDFSKRVNLASTAAEFSSPVDAVAVSSNDIYVAVSEGPVNLTRHIVHMDGDGKVLSSFPVDPRQTGLGYVPSSDTFIAINYSERNNPKIVEFGVGNSANQSFAIDDPYLSLGGGTVGAAFDPFNQSIYTSYFNQTGNPAYDHALAEYKLGDDSQYYVSNIYDLRSVGITGAVLAMDINRSNGDLYVQENNSRIVAFSSSDLRLLAPVPEPETYALMLVGLGVLGFMAHRKREGKRV
jgi:hypothetical protein